PEVALCDILGLASEVPDEERNLVVIRPAGGDVYALAVDRIHDHEELVVKPAAPQVMATGLYAGTTLADDGSPILLFDPAGLAEVGGVKLEAPDRTAHVAQAPAAAAAQVVTMVLFRGIDGARRALRLAVVDRIEEVPVSAIRPGAGQLRVQLGDSILPLAGVNAGPGGDLGEEKVRVFRLNDGNREIGYVFREVIDLAPIDSEVIPAENPGEISAVTLIAGEPAELVDAHWLFAHHLAGAAGAKASGKAQPLCRLPSDDPWMQNMLRPIIEAVGYRVVGDEHDGEADLVIASQGKAQDFRAARVILLRSEPDAAGDKDESIYRYDRAGLLMALKSAGAAGAKPKKVAGRGK
ncbi:MAG TPA: chemotaxis protein CheW, partial [Sphingomicrobium sp.]|nr:chemotaxis protein CheW [Sphingomicrobium sp.]